MANVKVPREVRRQLDDLERAKTSGKILFMGNERYAWEGVLCSKETYKAMKKAGAVHEPEIP